MSNLKYYQDIKNFPAQFREGFKNAANVMINKPFTKIIVCGMGGSSLYVELVNDYILSTGQKVTIKVARGYEIPPYVDENYLVIAASHSGNTEETLSCLEEAVKRNLNLCVFASGGKLDAKAKELNIPMLKIPAGGQPRLATGYFITGLLSILFKNGLLSDESENIINSAEAIDNFLDEEMAKSTAASIKGKVPVIYATDNNSSLARISKIKFNENSKTQSFWNFFPELNHNEMVGFTNLVMVPYFIIFKSKFTGQRNHRRINIFKQLLEEKALHVNVIELQGENVLAEILHGYYLVDHITYYLAAEYGIDPEPVNMVEDFKKML